MRPVSESRVVLISVVMTVVILLLFALSLGAVLLMSRQGADPTMAAATESWQTADSTTTPTTTAAPQPRATRGTGAMAVATATGDVVTGVSESTTTAAPATPSPSSTTSPSATPAPTAPPLTATDQPSATSIPTTPPPTATARPSATPVPTVPQLTATMQPSATIAASRTPAPSSTPVATPTSAVVASLHWPDILPAGMSFTAEDSWPFRTIAADRENEPFLIFRGGSRWLLIRNQAGVSQPVPRSATTQTLQIAGAQATLVKYLGGGFKLVLQRDGRTVQMSGQDVPDEDISRTAASLRPLSTEALRARLSREAAQQKFHVTFLWPSYLPPGMTLAPTETIAQIAQSAGDLQADGYRVSFRGTDALIQVGGGAINPPMLAGTTERITTGPLTGLLTIAPRRFLLVVDAGAGGPLPRFPAAPGGGPKQLPLVQQGRVFVAAENIDRTQFDRVVANLTALGTQEFATRARGQNTSNLTYLWPGRLPNGYSIDLSTVRVPWDDFLLQGGSPFFELTASGPGGTAIIKGGRESSGEPFVVPEGGDVERSTTNIRGHIASAAQTPDGSVLFWSENDSLYTITSPSLPVGQLTSIGEGLQPVDADDFYHRIR